MVVFRALEAEHLLALPRRPFEAASWQTAKVSPDCHISVGGALLLRCPSASSADASTCA